MTFWESLWLVFEIFIFVAYIIILFNIITDLFRDRKLNGFFKALWFLALLVVPLLSALFYLIFRGSGMEDRRVAAAKAAESQTAAYIRSVAANAPADQIAAAKALLDDGTITQAEFDKLKAKVIG